MVTKTLVALAAIGLLFLYPAAAGSPPRRSSKSADVRLADSVNSFGFALLKKLASDSPPRNVFISPFSISTALAMTLNGAAGKTSDEIRQTLALGDLSLPDGNDAYAGLQQSTKSLDPKVAMRIANSIWFRKGLEVKPQFLAVNQKCFNAEVRGLDFANPSAAKTINAWVDRSTNGKIPTIVDDPVSQAAVMFLINAIYFKGSWTKRFDAALTKEAPFTLADGSKTSCKLMAQGGEFRYLENEVLQAVDLPYGDGAFAMTVLLPKADVKLDVLLAEIDRDRWSQWLRALANREGDLLLPKVTLEYEKSLKDTLQAMGMTSAFDPGAADFSGISEPRGGERLFISEVKHKAFVEVNEEGTEAAAATSVEIKLTSAVAPRRFVMRVDHPFAFVIRDTRSGAILFIGVVVQPLP